MKEKRKVKQKKKINWKSIFEIVYILVILAVAFAATKYEKNTYDSELNETKTQYEQQMQEKDNQIKILEEEKTNLNTKVEELNKEIEALKVAKAKKATITSRGGSKASRETVQASAPLKEDWIWANASAYCACVKCCGKTNGITASGTKATAGRTIAAPKNYPFGTKIEIAGMGTYVVEDRGGAITGNNIDIYFDSHAEALKFGRRNLQIKVLD